MKRLMLGSALLLVMGTLPGLASQSTFERTISVSGAVTLHVATGSGYIHIKTGSDNKVHIVGRVKSHGFGECEDRVRQIAAHPPIEQTGSILRLGAHQEGLQNISIDYEIEAPARTYLQASSGSGDVEDDGVGVDARLNSGSGNIHAKGLKESFTVGTGSGDIYAEQVGTGDVKANTGSGSIELRNISGGIKAQTGSGSIKIGGQPKADWKVVTGSGGVELWPEKAGFDIDASTGSGDVHTDREMTVQGAVENHHHLSGRINGGGPTVRVETGSGDIRVH